MTLHLSAERFERLVVRALDLLPPEFQKHLENVSVEIAEAPEPELLESMGMNPADPGDTLFGLYEGTPLTDRFHDDVLLPDRILVYRQPLLEWCESEDEVVDEVRVTVLHEIGHFFGMDEDRLEELGYS